MKKRSSSPSILADGFRRGNDVFMHTGEEKQEESDDDCVVLEVIHHPNKRIKRLRADSTSTVSEGSFKSVSSKSNHDNEHRVKETTILENQSFDLSTSEPPANSGSLVSPLPDQVRFDCVIETGEGGAADSGPSSTMSQPKSKYPDWLSETYVKATSLNDLSSSRDRSTATSNSQNSQNSISFTRRNSDEVHVLLSEENENYGESIEDDVFSDGNVEVVDYSENEHRTRHQSDGDVGVVPTLEPSHSKEGDAQPPSLIAEQTEIESNNSGALPGAASTSEASTSTSFAQSGTVTQDDEDTDPLCSIDRLKFRNRSRSPQVPGKLTSSNRSVERSDDTRTPETVNRRSSRDNESSDHGENRGTKRAYEGESSFNKRKCFADSDSHHRRSLGHHEQQRRSRHYERDREPRSRRKSRSLPRRHDRDFRGLDQDFDRGFKYYEPRGNSRRGKNCRFPPVQVHHRHKNFEHQRSFYDSSNFKRKKQFPPAASTQFLKDNTFPSKLQMNYRGSSEMAGSSQSAKLRDQYLRTERERVNKDMNVASASQSTQTRGNSVPPIIENKQDNPSVVTALPTTTQNCNVRSSPECSVSSSHVPVASNGDGGNLTRKRPTARAILEILKKCPYPRCDFRDTRDETRKHLKKSHGKELCMFCLPNIHCVEHRNVGPDLVKHFNKDHAISKEDRRARCTLCSQLFNYEGIYAHMAKMHFIPIELPNEKPVRRMTKKEKEEKVKSCTNVQSEASSSCSSSPNSSPIVGNNRPTTVTSDARTRKFGENVNSTASRLVGTEGRANQNPTANRRSVDLIHPQRADQVPRHGRQDALNPNPRIHTQGTQRSDDVEENMRNASRNLPNYRIPKKTKPN